MVSVVVSAFQLMVAEAVVAEAAVAEAVVYPLLQDRRHQSR